MNDLAAGRHQRLSSSIVLAISGIVAVVL